MNLLQETRAVLREELPKERMKLSMKNNGFTIRCCSHTYITLEFDGKFVLCLDNDMMYAEEMIHIIEKRTNITFQDIPIKGCSKEDFQGLRFFQGGWKRDFWAEFPDKKEVETYMKLKNGM